MLIDTHIHLDATEFACDRDQVIDTAREAGVARFVVPGVEASGFAALRALARTHDDVRLAFGIHPLYVAGAEAGDLERVEAELVSGEALAVGEIGLDGFVTEPDITLQERFYVAQLKLARQHDLPVILHVRRAVDLILKHLRRIQVCGGIAHAFNGSRQQADALIALGFKLGFGGAMTFSGSTRIRRLAAELPLDSIVLETDAPDIPPAWANGARNEPANLERFAEVLAALRNLTVEEVAAATTANARSVLRGL
jgi:TatD DNase family protein